MHEMVIGSLACLVATIVLTVFIVMWDFWTWRRRMHRNSRPDLNKTIDKYGRFVCSGCGETKPYNERGRIPTMCGPCSRMTRV